MATHPNLIVNEAPPGNLALAILAGIVAAALGALVWMGITVASGLHVGYVALGVGAIVGYAIRLAGRGTTPVYGVIGAVLTLLGCLTGEILSVIQLAATQDKTTFFALLPNVDLTKLLPVIFEHTGVITYFIYAIGIYEGYKLSIRR
jgi:hypothetical protein